MPAKKQISDKQLKEIYHRYQNKETLTDLAKEFNVSQPALSKRLKNYSPPPQPILGISPSKPKKVSTSFLRGIVSQLIGKEHRGTLAQARDELITILQQMDDSGVISGDSP